MNKKNEKSFEDALQRLEEIAQLLENENTPLEDSIKLFEEGIELKDFCEEKLKSAKLKINKIINLLKQKSEEKYNKGDFKGSIRALRRSEKYLAK